MRLYVTGIPHTWTSTQLRELFHPYGKLTYAEVRDEKHDDRKLQRYGVVKFNWNDNAKEAILRLSGAKVHGHVLTVTDTCPLPMRHTC